jgi:acyl-CoA reductase-like NAD-dependent aldehyde dehydrogenase
VRKACLTAWVRITIAGQTQRKEVRDNLAELMKGSELVYGDPNSVSVTGADAEKGAFMSPILLLNKDPWKNQQCHNIEAFGPVSTLMPYTDHRRCRGPHQARQGQPLRQHRDVR